MTICPIISLDNSPQIASFTRMTNRLAVIIALLIVAFFVLDHLVFKLDAGVFLVRKGLELITWMKFWR